MMVGGGDQMCSELFSPSSLVNALTQSLTLAFCSLAHKLCLHSSCVVRLWLLTIMGTLRNKYFVAKKYQKYLILILHLIGGQKEAFYFFAYFINKFSLKVQLWGPTNSRKCVLENAKMSSCISVASQLYSLYITEDNLTKISPNLFTKRYM